MEIVNGRDSNGCFILGCEVHLCRRVDLVEHLPHQAPLSLIVCEELDRRSCDIQLKHPIDDADVCLSISII